MLQARTTTIQINFISAKQKMEGGRGEAWEIDNNNKKKMQKAIF